MASSQLGTAVGRRFFSEVAKAVISVTAVAALMLVGGSRAFASDHLDTPTVIADPAADIGDIFAWTATDGQHLNLVMDIVAHRFSDRLQYVLHVDSGKGFGATTTTTIIVCRFDAKNTAECWLGDVDYVHGVATNPAGIDGKNHRFRLFAGLRDDPFFNNVKGTRAMYGVAGTAIHRGAQIDAAGCPRFDRATTKSILDTWRHTDGGPATNFLAGWKSSSLVMSVDLGVLTTGGSYLAVWATVHRVPSSAHSKAALFTGATPSVPSLGVQIERTARPLIKNALVGGPLAADSVSSQRKEAYNRAARNDWSRFSVDIQNTLGLYDGLNGRCGDQWLADSNARPGMRYERLARLLADDRIWINTASAICDQFMAVELVALHSPSGLTRDCGGRTPNYDASNIFRSLLTNGMLSGVDDGLQRDDRMHSATTFPFLAAP